MSSRTRPFSIFLLKNGFDALNALKEGNILINSTPSKALPENSSLYILDSPTKEPWWKNYFQIKLPLPQASKGALVFIPVLNRIFALSFGHVFHNLKDNSYEYDFGLRVTLNSLDPNKLKSADIMDPGASRRKRTQVPSATDLTFLDFDSNAEIIRSLTGSVKDEFLNLFKSATGSASLKIGLKLDVEELSSLCEELLGLYSSEEYLKAFPNIGKIKPETDPDVVKPLDNKLLKKFIERSDELSLSIPDIIDYQGNTYCRFQGRGGIANIYADVSLEAFYDYLGDNYDFKSATIETLKSFSIVLCDSEGNISKAYSIYNCLLLDISGPKKVFHICEGNWYAVDASYVQSLKTYLDKKCEPTDLINYDHDTKTNGELHYSEENYNLSVVKLHNHFICLDQTNMSPTGSTQIEPCDLYKVSNDPVSNKKISNLYHIKISTRSSQLSHLFNQGVNSAELLVLEPSFRETLKDLIDENIGGNDKKTYCEPIDSKNLKIIYGVITKKDPKNLSDNLPLFSKISLMRCCKSLDLMQMPVALTFIPDDSKQKGKYSSLPTVTVQITDISKGKKVIRVIAGQAIAAGTEVLGCNSKIKNSVNGSKYKIFYKKDKNGKLRTNHKWEYEAIL
ncbi:DUF6119 family protein [Pseudomonas viridiflava]|uniref:DUF6119 family protein n=1 Tax=Pseudomonas viridiflava TaxID=33069 RepID=UPI000F01FAB1|nr:DUF6119 family protein [Pseudomonas viridiflava]